MIDREEAKQLYKDWEEAVHREEDAASEVATLEEKLSELGIDPSEPPSWLTE